METMLRETLTETSSRAHSVWLCYLVLKVPEGTFSWTLKTEQKRRKQSAGPWKMSHGKATSDQSESREKRINESRDEMFLSKAKRNQATKGIRRMPWRHEPMKDAISCEKPRGTANKYRSVGVRMGKPGSRYGLSPCKGREPGELKHLSSRRKRNQTRCPQ